MDKGRYTGWCIIVSEKEVGVFSDYPNGSS
jgi:hypothetical protein